MTRRVLIALWCAGMLLLVACRGSGSAPWPTEAPAAALPWQTRPPELEDIPRVSAEALWERMQAGEAILVVDVRSLAEYEQEHVAGAVSIPVDEMASRTEEFPRGVLVVFY